MIKVTLWVIFIAGLCYIGFCVLLYFKQRSLLFYPVPEVHTGEADVIYLSNGEQNLKIWQITGSSDKALIYFGGNAEDVSDNIPLFKEIFTGYSVYLLNYRGYGGSSGSPSEEALFSDSLVLYDFLRKEYKSISVMGRSLGTGVAAYLAAQQQIDNLILVTPYDSMVNVAASYHPFIPVSRLMKDRFDSVRLTDDINVRTLVLIAEFDEVIPRKNSNILVSALDSEMTKVVIVEGANHNNIGIFPVYPDTLRTFISLK